LSRRGGGRGDRDSASSYKNIELPRRGKEEGVLVPHVGPCNVRRKKGKEKGGKDGKN